MPAIAPPETVVVCGDRVAVWEEEVALADAPEDGGKEVVTGIEVRGSDSGVDKASEEEDDGGIVEYDARVCSAD